MTDSSSISEYIGLHAFLSSFEECKRLFPLARFTQLGNSSGEAAHVVAIVTSIAAFCAFSIGIRSCFELTIAEMRKRPLRHGRPAGTVDLPQKCYWQRPRHIPWWHFGVAAAKCDFHNESAASRRDTHEEEQASTRGEEGGAIDGFYSSSRKAAGSFTFFCDNQQPCPPAFLVVDSAKSARGSFVHSLQPTTLR